MARDAADRVLCQTIHSSGNELILLHRELLDIGVFDRGTFNQTAPTIFPGILPRSKFRATTVYVTPAEEEDDLNPVPGPKAQILVVGADASHLAMLVNFYGNPDIESKYQVRMIKLLSSMIPTINRYLRETVRKDYIYLVGSPLSGNSSVLWAPPRIKCKMGSDTAPKILLTLLQDQDVDKIKETKPVQKKTTSPNPVRSNSSKKLLKCCLLLLCMSTGTTQQVDASCNRVDGDLLLCSKIQVQDELRETAEILILPSYNEVTELLMICEKLRRHKVTENKKKYNSDTSVQSFGRLSARGCEHELRTQNATLPSINADLIEYLQVEEIPKDSVWIQVKLGPTFPTPVPLSLAHRDLLGERWMETAGTKNQRIHFPESYRDMQVQGNLLIKNVLTIRACLEQTSLKDTSFTHASLEIQPDKTVLCILVDCRQLNCSRVPAHQASVLLLQETYLYGGLVGMPMTPNVEDGKLTASCLIHPLNEVPLTLTPHDHQEVMLAVNLLDKPEAINQCFLYISTNSATGQAENRGHDNLCLGLTPTSPHIPILEPCLAVKTLLGDPRVGQDQAQSESRKRRSLAAVIMNLIRLTSSFGTRIGAQASRFLPGVAGRTMQSATPLSLGYTPVAASRLSLDAISLAGTEIAKTGLKETLVKLASNTIIQAIGIGAATTITSVAVPLVLEGAAAKLRELEARELKMFIDKNYETSQDAIRGLSNFSHISWGIEGNLRLTGGPEVLPSNHTSDPIRLSLPAPKSDIFSSLFPQSHTTSFRKIGTLQLRLWELLTFYVECAEILVKAFRGDLLLPGLTKKLEAGEYWIISLLEDRAKQSKYKKDGLRVDLGEVQTDLYPVLDNQGRLRRLKTLEISGRFDPCRAYHSGWVAPFCWFYSSKPFMTAIPLLGGQLVTVYDLEISVACGDGTVHLGKGEYAVFTVPEECLIEQGVNIGHPAQISSKDDIKVYCRVKIEHLPNEQELSRYQKLDPYPTPEDKIRNKKPQDEEPTTIFPLIITTTAWEVYLTIPYHYRVIMISSGIVLLVLVACLSLFTDLYSQLFRCLTTCLTEIGRCRQARQTTIQNQRRQENMSRLTDILLAEAASMLPVAVERN